MDLADLFKNISYFRALDWVEIQPDQSLAALYETCPRGDWLLWALRNLGLDVSNVGFWCAERARQSALRALDVANVTGPKVDRLRACAPVVDKETARIATEAAVKARAAKAAEAAADAAGAAAWAAWAAAWAADAAAAEDTARETEHQVIADHVRKTFPWVVVEAAIAAKA